MAMQFDATLKDLVESFVEDFQAQLGFGDLSPMTPLNVDLSTISATSDL